MPLLPSARPASILLLLPVFWLACGGGGSSSTTSGSGGSTSSTTSSTAGTGGSASSSSSTGGSGGAGTTSSASTTSTSSGSGGGLTGTRVRVAAANLTSGGNQSYDPGEGIRILQGIHADVIVLQEMNYGDNSGAKLQDLVNQICGSTCVYARGGGAIPNAVVSAYPILASGTWADPQTATRDFTWARLDVPGPVDLWAVSAHLLTSSTTVRDAEAKALLAQLDANVPSGDYLVVGGDFNTDVRAEPMITTLSARLATAAPYPADGNGNDNTSKPRTRPYDWALASPSLVTREAPVVMGTSTFAHGLVVDTRIYTPLADITPALQGDSGATGMQHMAVVRDFLLE